MGNSNLNNNSQLSIANSQLTVCIVGVGLISGSFALAMKKHGFAKHVIGVSRTKASELKALELGLIDEAIRRIKNG